MKKHISKIAAGFSAITLIITVLHFITGVTSGYLFHGSQSAYSYLIGVFALLGVSVLFLCLYRIIDLLEKK